MMSCSPKELIQNTSLTPEEMAQVGIRSEHIGGDVFQLRGLDVRQKIKNVIAFWRRIAEAHIEDSPATDGTLDRTAAAKAILYRLGAIECFLAAAERDGASGDLYLAVYHSLLLSIEGHQLTVVHNETALAAQEDSIKGARHAGMLRSAKVGSRNREMAQEYQKRWELMRSQGRKKSKTALMAEIGAARNLKRRASINAIESGLKELNRDESNFSAFRGAPCTAAQTK